MKSYTLSRRKEMIDEIKSTAERLKAQMGDGERHERTAWRIAVENWLHKHGLIGVSLGSKVSPNFPPHHGPINWLSAQGRFWSLDPIKDGNNWYTYVGNAPTIAVDPEGRDGFEPPKPTPKPKVGSGSPPVTPYSGYTGGDRPLPIPSPQSCITELALSILVVSAAQYANQCIRRRCEPLLHFSGQQTIQPTDMFVVEAYNKCVQNCIREETGLYRFCLNRFAMCMRETGYY